MNIAVIGTGNVGTAVGASLTRAGHTVTFAARDAAKAEAVAREMDAGWAATPLEAVEHAETAIIAVPYSSVASLAAEIEPATGGKLVIDATNPLTPDYSAVATAGGPSAAEQLAEALPGARVVKAFNTLFATIQGNPAASSEPVDALFATDDDEARAEFGRLAESIGLRPVHVGPLTASRELEAMAFLNIRLQLIKGGQWNTTIKLVDAPEAALAA